MGKIPIIKIILSSKHQLPENPLDCDSYKGQLVKDIFDIVNTDPRRITCDVICAPKDENGNVLVYKSISNVLIQYKSGYWLAGSDRAKEYNGMIKYINKGFVPPSLPSNIIVKSLERTGDEEQEVDPFKKVPETIASLEEVSPEEKEVDRILASIVRDPTMNATRIRTLVKEGDENKFLDIMRGTGLADDKLRQLYKEILTSEPPEQVKSKKVKLRGGGGTRRTNTRKYRKTRKRHKKARRKNAIYSKL